VLIPSCPFEIPSKTGVLIVEMIPIVFGEALIDNGRDILSCPKE
jgi:hypothetical protein